MIFNASLLAALTVFLVGLGLKISTWFRFTAGGTAREPAPASRVKASLRGMRRAVFSRGIAALLRALVVDVLLLARLWRESRLRWLAHMTIFYGFSALLLFHALERPISANLFPDYESTLNPYLFLRNLSFLLVLLGAGIAAGRRLRQRTPRFASNRADVFLAVILAAVMVSGVLLEAAKMGSHSEYLRMVQEYSTADDEEELRALEAYWVSNFGIVSPTAAGPFGGEVLSRGRDLHEDSCADCHSNPRWAFVSYGLAGALRPLAGGMEKLKFPLALWIIHWIACFAGLACLPFTKMFHAITSPLSLLVNAVAAPGRSDPATAATRQLMELDACVHCGICTARCSVAVAVLEIPNQNILPAEKIVSLKSVLGKGEPDIRELKRIQEGLHLCTSCRHCTDACPVGINLQELWFDVREAVARRGLPEMLALSALSNNRGLNKDLIAPEEYPRPAARARRALEETCVSLESLAAVDESRLSQAFRTRLAESHQGGTCSTCLECRICTASCPVVRQTENPPGTLGLVPHQIMHAAKLGLAEPVYRSAMLWKCLGCYQCQENCPQGVRVTDVLYELRSMAAGHVRSAAAGALPEARS